jgi:hypothetical protein
MLEPPELLPEFRSGPYESLADLGQGVIADCSGNGDESRVNQVVAIQPVPSPERFEPLSAPQVVSSWKLFSPTVNRQMPR